MSNLSPDLIVMVVCVGAFTALSAVLDLRFRKIPNILTFPVFIFGLAYQITFHGWAGLADAGLAFLFGFGTLFVLWMVGGGGGGDVKLMGALSVWIGFYGTLYVMIASTVFVILGTIALMIWTFCSRGFAKPHRPDETEADFDASSQDAAARPKQRRVMPYALPVALATWVVLLGEIGPLLLQ